MSELRIKYGMNPNQAYAKISCNQELPITVLNGTLSYINVLDALNSWQLVKELREALNLPAAASFKHVSPAGAAVGLPLSDVLKKAYFVENMELSPLASAYARARGADRMSSFGDWVALSDTVDVATARLLAVEVSDGVIAPGYTPEALAILKAKKKGKYNIVQIDYHYSPEAVESRTIYGITLEQERNNKMLTFADLTNIVTARKDLPEAAKRDLLIAMITLKYTQSNSVCYVTDGQVIGNGAGQQSRIHCTRLAGDKADTWFLRQHPAVLNLQFREGIGRPDRDNAIDLFLREDVTEKECEVWETYFTTVPERLTREEKAAWLINLQNVSLGSDGFIPFRDNIDRAIKSGVKYVAQPGGSIRDDLVIEACDDYGIIMICTGLRLFHH